MSPARAQGRIGQKSVTEGRVCTFDKNRTQKKCIFYRNIRNPAETALVYHPISEGWVGFALDTAGMTVARLGELFRDLPPEELAHRLLGPFRYRLASASTLRVLGYRWLRGIKTTVNAPCPEPGYPWATRHLVGTDALSRVMALTLQGLGLAVGGRWINSFICAVFISLLFLAFLYRA